jgi:hypothetical protein
MVLKARVQARCAPHITLGHAVHTLTPPVVVAVAPLAKRDVHDVEREHRGPGPADAARGGSGTARL